MKTLLRKEILFLIVGESISLGIIIWLLYKVPRSPGAEPLSKALIDYGPYGWLWFIVLSFSIVLLLKAVVFRIRKNISQTSRYSRLCILFANASIAASLFLSSSLQWNEIYIEANWKGLINSYCSMIIMTGAAIALIEYLVLFVILLNHIENSSKYT